VGSATCWTLQEMRNIRYLYRGASLDDAPVELIKPSADSVKATMALQEMKQKLQRGCEPQFYKMRKAVVEPVFGQIKECHHFRR